MLLLILKGGCGNLRSVFTSSSDCPILTPLFILPLPCIFFFYSYPNDSQHVELACIECLLCRGHLTEVRDLVHPHAHHPGLWVNQSLPNPQSSLNTTTDSSVPFKLFKLFPRLGLYPGPTMKSEALESEPPLWDPSAQLGLRGTC
jgi:hypothetical protein